MKKAIASQLQLDITGVRRVEELKSNYSSWEQSNTAFSVYEVRLCCIIYIICMTLISRIKDRISCCSNSVLVYIYTQDSVTGDCRALVQVSRLPAAQCWSWADQYVSVCKGAHFFEVTKNKDLNHCNSSPYLNWSMPPTHTCDIGAGNCGDALQVSNYFFIKTSR